ncbi:MAG: thioredoxin-disulfide reductase [Planctomycetota bacterium]
MNYLFKFDDSTASVEQFLKESDVQFEIVSPDGRPEAIDYVKSICGKAANLLMANGKALVNPTPADASRLVLGKEVDGERRNFDALILGGGPAGLTAAIYLTRGNLSAAVIEELMPGGLMTKTDEIENYPGFPEGVNGFEISKRMEQQAKRFGTHFISGRVEEVLLDRIVKEVVTPSGVFWSPNVIICFGTEHKHMDVPGEKEFYGLGVSYCATCDGPLYRGRDVVVIGGGDSAVQEAIFLSKLCRSVKVVHRRDELRAEKILQQRAFNTPNIEFVWNSLPVEVVGSETGVSGMKVRNKIDGVESIIPCDCVFVFIGLLPRVNVKGMEILEKDELGFIRADEHTRTAIPGVFAAGDIRSGNIRQIATAVGDGCNASHSAEQHLVNLSLPEWPA